MSTSDEVIAITSLLETVFYRKLARITSKLSKEIEYLLDRAAARQSIDMSVLSIIPPHTRERVIAVNFTDDPDYRAFTVNLAIALNPYFVGSLYTWGVNTERVVLNIPQLLEKLEIEDPSPLFAMAKQIVNTLVWVNRVVSPWLKIATAQQIVNTIPLKLLYDAYRGYLSTYVITHIQKYFDRPPNLSAPVPRLRASSIPQYLQMQARRSMLYPAYAQYVQDSLNAADTYYNRLLEQHTTICNAYGVSHTEVNFGVKPYPYISDISYLIDTALINSMHYKVPGLQKLPTILYAELPLLRVRTSQYTGIPAPTLASEAEQFMRSYEHTDNASIAAYLAEGNYPNLYYRGGMELPEYVVTTFAQLAIGIRD